MDTNNIYTTNVINTFTTNESLVYITIDENCIDGYPCKHKVEYLLNDYQFADNCYFNGIMNCNDIYEICKLYNQTIPQHIHFYYNLYNA